MQRNKRAHLGGVKVGKMAVNDCLKYFSLCDNLPLKEQDFYNFASHLFPQYGELSKDSFIEVLISNHAPILRIYKNNEPLIISNQHQKSLRDSTLCFVDIETSGSKDVLTGQIIELGAIKVRNNVIVDKFESFVYANFIPEEIIDLTGINTQMLKKAPRLKKVLVDFKDFLGDSVFVAHNVGFDYGFITESLRQCNLPMLFNARFCTLDLSRIVIPSQKHALSYLNEILGINNTISHRALADAITSFEVYKICNLALPFDIESVQDLIDFSKGRIMYPTRASSNNKLKKHTTKYQINTKDIES